MYKFEEICELIELVGSSGVAVVEIEHAGSRVRVEGRTQTTAAPAAALAASPAVGDTSPAPPSAPAAAAETQSAPADAAAVDEDMHVVNSPIVGTFYRAPNPDADPYVKVGDFVEQGQTLCIVEAMKLMNEIESDVSGTIVKVLPADAQPVEFGEQLFVVRSS
jgi:acetyl-CoA carboxylase biotin carboxyl carrier protein